MKVHLYNYSKWMEPIININEGNALTEPASFTLTIVTWTVYAYQAVYINMLQTKKNLTVSPTAKAAYAWLKAGVGYKRKNKPQFWHFLFGTQAVKISRSS